MEDNKEKRGIGSLLHLIFTHPYGIPLVGAVASIVAIPLALLVWPAHRELTYAVQPIRTTLSRNIIPLLKVTFNGREITNDIYAAQVMIANLGRESIKPEHFAIQPYIIVSNSEVLSVTFTRTAKEGTDIDVTSSTNTLPFLKSTIPLTWKILEKNDQPVIQIFYAGDANAPIRLLGRIEGQDEIKQSEWSNPKASFLKRGIALVLLGAMCGLIFGTIGEIRREKDNKTVRRIRIVVLVVFIVSAGGICWVLFR